MYTGYELSPESRSQIARYFPPKYSKFIGHHVTERYPSKPTDPAPDQPKEVKVIGYIDSGDGVEGFLVQVDGKVNRPSGGKYHLTWSLAEGRKPVETNNYVDSAVSITPFNIEVTAKNFGK